MDCIYVDKAEYAGDFNVRLRFNGGTEGVADLEEIIFRYEATEPLRPPEAFAKFHLDSWPTLTWDCGFDVAPESLYERCQPTLNAAEEPTAYTSRRERNEE